ncbi:MAG: hypothetical protein A3J84_03100 [Ignavibacteria bacterium RIFOXYA2_FULL_37_17]|nr:MAG: hypothetical protein A3J84_03100 [Ignavibacteria bacterium RIFOXYA2_FULL_37_17]
MQNDYPELKERLRAKKFDFKKGFDEKLFFNIQPKGQNGQLSNHHKNIPDLRRQPLKDKIKLHNNFEKIISPWKS